MPLFMLISGYLFCGSVIKNKMVYNVRSRFTALLIPIMLWSIIPYVIRLVQGDERSIWLVVRAYFTTCIGNLWFLWAVFYCSFIVLFVNRYFGDSIVVYGLLAVVMLVTPDLSRLHLYKFMYGYFVAGYMFRKNNYIEKLRGAKKGVPAIAVGMAVAYMLLMYFYDRDCYIYTSGYTLLRDNALRQLGIDIFRFITGMAGCAVMFMVSAIIRNISRIIYGNNMGKIVQKFVDLLAYIGRNTFGIYVVSTLLFSYVIKPLAWNVNGIDYLLVTAEAVGVLGASLAITELVRRIPVLGQLLLGNRR